jgi:murein DD-endopeptidase MepM/ murein hydrolase activator NlpD
MMDAFHRFLTSQRQRFARLGADAGALAARRPNATRLALVGFGLALGLGTSAGAGSLRQGALESQLAAQRTQSATMQRELNAMAARLGELQAEANRLNALGDRLTRAGQLGDGEFDFDKPVPVGGVGPVHDIGARELDRGIASLAARFGQSGEQLSVLESLLFSHKLEQDAVPAGMPVANSYITSGFGGRADPMGGGGEFHKGIDFKATTGDPVLSVADGVVSFAGVRSGYGNVVEIDHGNGYVTRYAHNSRLLLKVGELVRAGQEVAKAGSTGRSTGAHVHFEVWENGRVVNPRKFLGQAQNRNVTRG